MDKHDGSVNSIVIRWGAVDQRKSVDVIFLVLFMTSISTSACDYFQF